MRAASVFLLLTVTALLIFTHPSFAANEALPIDMAALEEETKLFKDLFVVTGTKQKRKTLKSPFSVFVLDRERIDALAASDLTELLAAVPGLDVYRVNDRVTTVAPPGFNSEIANQFLLLVDGVPFPTIRGGGADFWQLPVQVDQVERIEYLPGPQTTLYGAYAAMGVINVITRRANPETWDEESPSSIRLRMGGDGLEQYESTYHYHRDDLAATFWTSFRSCDGYDQPLDSRTLAPSTSFFDQDGSINRKIGLSLRKEFDQNRSLRYDLTYLRGDRSPILPTLEGDAREHRQNINSVITYSDSPSIDDSFTLVLKNFNKNTDFSDYKTPAFNPPGESDEFEDRKLEIRRQFKDSRGRRFTLNGEYQHIIAFVNHLT